jgi:hypothetical protein
VGQGPSDGYYEEAEGRRDNTRRKPSQPGTPLGVGPGLCGTPQNAGKAKFAEFPFHALG